MSVGALQRAEHRFFIYAKFYNPIPKDFFKVFFLFLCEGLVHVILNMTNKVEKL